MTPRRRSLVIPNHVPPAGDPASRPHRTQASSVGAGIDSKPDEEEEAMGSKECQEASVAGRSRYSSRLEAKILFHQTLALFQTILTKHMAYSR
jgi:hypothetical protein